MLERAIREYQHEDPVLFFLCGMANYSLGYLLNAEQLIEKAISFNKLQECDLKLDQLAHTQLGHVLAQQEKTTAAIEAYSRALELDTQLLPVAVQIGKLYFQEGNNTLALEYFDYALEVANADLMSVRPETLADIYLQKVKVFESLGMLEHARQEQKKVLNADPTFAHR